jgi:hypothetical protein
MPMTAGQRKIVCNAESASVERDGCAGIGRWRGFVQK